MFLNIDLQRIEDGRENKKESCINKCMWVIKIYILYTYILFQLRVIIKRIHKEN